MNKPSDPFARSLAALHPWLDQLVIIGGWAHKLYRLHHTAQQLNYPPLITLDTDIAIPLNIPRRKEDIRSRLLTHGFTEELLGTDKPPATHYHLKDDASGFYLEFLTSLTGGEHTRTGRRKATIDIAGITSQRLRHIELLLLHPWSVDFPSSAPTVKVQIANPANFIAQKILIHQKRKRADRAKDILYIHDTLETFGSSIPELRKFWLQSGAPQLNHRHAAIVSKAADNLFGNSTDDIQRSALISAERRLSPESIREACRYGLLKLFG